MPKRSAGKQAPSRIRGHAALGHWRWETKTTMVATADSPIPIPLSHPVDGHGEATRGQRLHTTSGADAALAAAGDGPGHHLLFPDDGAGGAGVVVDQAPVPTAAAGHPTPSGGVRRGRDAAGDGV